MEGYIYIMASKNNRVLYTGSTRNLIKRVWEHKNKVSEKSFTARYNVIKLVYYERYDSIAEAVGRESQIKAGSRKKKESLIKQDNPNFVDLSERLL